MALGIPLWRSQRRSWSQPTQLAGPPFLWVCSSCRATGPCLPCLCPPGDSTEGRVLDCTSPAGLFSCLPCRWAPTCLCPPWVAQCLSGGGGQGCVCCQGRSSGHHYIAVGWGRWCLRGVLLPPRGQVLRAKTQWGPEPLGLGDPVPALSAQPGLGAPHPRHSIPVPAPASCSTRLEKSC